ncbi:MAG: hypothetical protein RLZ98_151 [Pseudomonadota bacterium]|jgi:hypothetical protein
MSYEINRLEEAWLKAESDADRAKREALKIDAVLSKGSANENLEDEFDVLMGRAESLRAQVAEAEQAAAEAFDRLWSAKGMNGTHA